MARSGGACWDGPVPLLPLLCVAATAALLALHLVAEARGWAALRALGKVGASLGFVGLALTRGVADPYDGWVLAGLCLSLVGDALLLSERRALFLGGLVAFLLAHLAYAAAFSTRAAPSPFAAAVLLVVVALVLRWLWPHLGGMKGPVVAYCLAIGAMVFLALGVPRAEVRFGALLFFASDLFVARQRFVGAKPANRLVGLPLYYAGQVLLALSVG